MFYLNTPNDTPCSTALYKHMLLKHNQFFEDSIDFLLWRHRQLTRYFRGFPDFLVIGAQKSGTTSLYYYLSEHPQLLPSFKKEVHFFNGGTNPNIDTYKRGTAWYRGHFPIKKKHSINQTYEVTPDYLFFENVPERINRIIPKVKLILILRNPTERAISHYFFSKKFGHEDLSIIEALKIEDKRLEPIIKNGDFKNLHYGAHSYKSRGLYKQQLERYLKYFDINQIHVFSTEELSRDPNATLKKLFVFLDVDDSFEVQNLQPRHISKNKQKVDQAVYDYLNEYFHEHNQELFQLLGRSFDW